MKPAQARALLIILQLVGWTVFLLLPGIFKPDLNSFQDLWHDLLKPIRLTSGLFCMGVFYLTYLVLVPRLLVPRRVGLLVLALAGILLAFTTLQYGLQHLPNGGHGHHHLGPPPGFGGPPPDLAKEGFHPGPDFRDRHGPHHGPRRVGLFSGFGPGAPLYQLLITLGVSFALGLAREWRREREQRLATEVAFLRAQINPHFLFNTLNTLYALTLAKSDTAPEAVLRLSAIMRYAVAQAGQQVVPLSEEITYLEGYLELQRLRLPPGMELEYRFPDQMFGAMIAPLLLVIPIENAFTHGVGQEQAGRIYIDMGYADRRLTLVVENDLPNDPAQPHASANLGSGLQRLRSYLDSRYPGRYGLDIQETESRFRLTLTLDLDA